MKPGATLPPLLPNLSRLNLERKTTSISSLSRDIYVYPDAILTGEMDFFNAGFVEIDGWRDEKVWKTVYGQGPDEYGVIQHAPGSSGNRGEKATIRIFYYDDRTETDVQIYEITLGDIASVLLAFFRYASFFGRLGTKLFASEESPWHSNNVVKRDQFDEFKAIIKKTESEIEMTDLKQRALRSLQGFVFECTRDFAEMKLEGKVFDKDFECGSFGLEYYEQRVEALKTIMVAVPFDFFVISAAEDAYSDDQFKSEPFVLKRFIATTLNFKMMRELQRFGRNNDTFTLLAIKIKAGARFLPMFSLSRSMQEYEIVIDNDQKMTPIKMEEKSSICELFGRNTPCRVAWLEVSKSI